MVRLGHVGVGIGERPHAGGELGLGDPSHVPDQVGGEGAVRVGPHRLALDVDGREVLGPLGQVDVEGLGNVDGDGHGLELAVLGVGQPALDAIDLGRDAEVGQLVGQAQDQVVALGLVHVGQDLLVDGHDQRGAVVDQHPPLGIEDAPPRGLLGDDPEPVLGRHLLVLVGRHDLEEPDAGEQGGEEREHDDAQDAQAQARRLGVHPFHSYLTAAGSRRRAGSPTPSAGRAGRGG